MQGSPQARACRATPSWPRRWRSRRRSSARQAGGAGGAHGAGTLCDGRTGPVSVEWGFDAHRLPQFVVRGNLIDLAVAVVIGTAFAASSPRSSRTCHAADRRHRGRVRLLGAHLRDQRQPLPLRRLHNALLAFLLVAAVLFFLVIRRERAAAARAQSESPEDDDSRKCRNASARYLMRRAVALFAPPSCLRPEPYAPEPCALPSASASRSPTSTSRG